MSTVLPTRRPRLGASRFVSAGVLGFVLALAGLVLGAGPASAHATLIVTDPTEGQVLAEAPDRAKLTFNEPVRLPAGGVHLFAADGTELPADANSSDENLLVELPASMADGTYVLAWRVISADGHPVGGALTFSIGSPSERVVTPRVDADTAGSGVEVGLAVIQGLVYIGLFVAVGLRFFASVLLPREPGLDDVRGRLDRIIAVAAWTAIGAAIVQLPLNNAYQNGTGLFDAVGPALKSFGSSQPEPWAAVLIVSGLLACLRSPARIGLVGGGIALAALALVGHTRSFGPPPLTLTADLAHVLTGSVWLGGLIGLTVALPRLSARPRIAVLTLARFSTWAAFLLTTVALSGSILAWRILGSWSGLVETSFGVTLLIKVGIVGLVVLLATWNRFRLLPAVNDESGHRQREEAGRRLRTTIGVEAALLVLVLGVTGVLVDRSPASSAGGGAIAAPAGLDARTYVGQAPGLRVVLRLDPLVVGANDVLVQLQDESENPIEPYAAPSVSFSLDELDLGEQVSTNIDSGTYRLRAVLPRAGEWTAEVTIRTGEFDSRVVPVRFAVR